MNFLESLFCRPGYAESVHSSEQYANAMIQGWVDGIECLDAQGDLKINAESVLGVEYKKRNMFGRLKSAGDIDLVMRFARDDLTLEDILPTTGYKIHPATANTRTFRGLLCEAKRTCNIVSVKKHIEQLVKFYTGLLKEVINDTNTPIVFLFNGADFVDVWKCFLSKVPSGTICGRNLCIIYCVSDQLTTWESTLLLQGSNNQLERNNFRLERNNHQLERSNNQLESALEEQKRRTEEERQQKEEERRRNEILMNKIEALELKEAARNSVL